MPPFFSVVVPTYNRAADVGAAVRSVLRQTDADFECLVVDDGSKDETPSVLRGFSDPRVRVWRHEANRGQAPCRNRAIREARGEWIAFLDSDDLYLPERLAQLRGLIVRRPRAGFLFTNAYVYRYGRVIGRLFDPARPIPEGRVPGYYALGDRYLPYVTTTVAIRRRAFDEVGLFREDLVTHEDMELYVRMLEKGVEVAALGEPSAVRFLHPGQLTADHLRDFRGSMDALASSDAPPEIAREIRSRIARETAGYLWRAARPAEAREVLRRELGSGGVAAAKTYFPPAALRVAGALRRQWLRLRFHPALAPREFRRVDELIAELRPS